MEVQLKEMLDDLVALKRSLPDLSHKASIDKVFLIHMRVSVNLNCTEKGRRKKIVASYLLI